jgi:hypothetical protein
MDQSDSESDADPAFDDDDGDRYPLEGKYRNASDKAEIMAMPEIKREELLAERAQEVERDRQNRALRQLLNAREADAKKQDKKRKAGAADLDENQRKTSRQRTKLGVARSERLARVSTVLSAQEPRRMIVNAAAMRTRNGTKTGDLLETRDTRMLMQMEIARLNGMTRSLGIRRNPSLQITGTQNQLVSTTLSEFESADPDLLWFASTLALMRPSPAAMLGSALVSTRRVVKTYIEWHSSKACMNPCQLCHPC